MAKNAVSGNGTGNQVIGKVLIIYGTAKAVAPDGTMRILAPNSPVFADEKIITESDGSVSIMPRRSSPDPTRSWPDDRNGPRSGRLCRGYLRSCR